jgi:benzoylformate decarboxylase
MDVREAVFDFLRGTGSTTVFGNPGSTEVKMLRDWPADFRYVLGLQESVVTAMAAGHAMGTGRAGVVSLHSAGGVGHALGAVFNAYRDRVPLLIIAGQQTRAMLPTRPFLAADEPASFPRPYVKCSSQPDRAEDVPAALAEAYRLAMTPPRGPVFVSVPEDDWNAAASPVPMREIQPDFVASSEGLRSLADALNASERPALVIGAGVDDDDAFAAVVALAEKTSAAVWLAPMSARSGFPEDHRLFQGFLPPVRDQVVKVLDGHDVVLGIGAPIFKYHVHTPGPYLPAGTRLFQLDCDPVAAAWAPVGTSLLGTVRASVTALLEFLDPVDRRVPAARPALTVASSPAAFVIDTLRATLPPGMVVVEEAPSHRDVFHERLPITRPGGFLTTGSGALGWGLPVAVGRALAGDPVVCVVGDGSSLYSIQALWSAAQYRTPVTFVVLNNHGYEAVRQLGRRLGNADPVGTEIPGVDFVAVANGFGVPARRVSPHDDLGSSLASAFAGDGPSLLEVPVDPSGVAAYS